MLRTLLYDLVSTGRLTLAVLITLINTMDVHIIYNIIQSCQQRSHPDDCSVNNLRSS